MKKRRNKLDRDAGVALATVLVMVSIMSALAVVVVEASRLSVQRTANQTMMEAAHWQLVGAEAHAINRISSLRASAIHVDESEWQNRDFTYPLDDGVLTLKLRDGSNCFNLNSVVEAQEDGAFVAAGPGQMQLARLLDLLDIRGQRGLVTTLADWIDSDTQSLFGGAEDGVNGDRSYRTANALLGDVGELRRVRGFTPEIIRTLAPHVCVRPNAGAVVLNVNTLTPDQAPVLAMALGGDVSVNAARDVIRRRPRGGWESVENFFVDPELARLEVTDALMAFFATESRYYVLSARIERGGFSEESAALIDGASPPFVVRRVLGAGVWDHPL